MSDDARFLRRALAIANRARTAPNPCVGAVIVRDGRIIGEGWTRPDRRHAEALALAQAGEDARGATLYVTLEPCAHTVRSDGAPRYPCARRCIDAGITRVVCAIEDPDPQVRGEGFRQLRAAGIDVEVGLGETQARRVHEAFLKHRTRGLPFVTHKAAMTMDGKLAAPGGDARWITGDAARAAVHRLRARSDAVVVGVGTVLADNPQLNVRLKRRGGNDADPLRVVIDSRLRTPGSARVAGPGTLFFTTDQADMKSRARLEAAGASVEIIDMDSDGRVDVGAAMRALASRGVLSALLECGGTLAASFFAANLVDRCWYFVAPKLIGGADATTPIDGAGLGRRMHDAIRLTPFRVQRYGEDVAIEADIVGGVAIESTNGEGSHVHGDR